MNNSQASLSSELLPLLVDTVLQAFDQEVARLGSNEKEVARIYDLFLSLHHTTRFHLYFMAASYEKLVENIFMDPASTDFVLSLTDRVSLMILADEPKNDDKIVEHMVRGVTRNKPDEGSASLLNENLIKSIHQTSEDLTKLLKDNFWLIVVYFLVMYFQNTQLFIKTSTPEPKAKK
jgi:hypothetical protein